MSSGDEDVGLSFAPGGDGGGVGDGDGDDGDGGGSGASGGFSGRAIGSDVVGSFSIGLKLPEFCSSTSVKFSSSTKCLRAKPMFRRE